MIFTVWCTMFSSYSACTSTLSTWLVSLLFHGQPTQSKRDSFLLKKCWVWKCLFLKKKKPFSWIGPDSSKYSFHRIIFSTNSIEKRLLPAQKMASFPAGLTMTNEDVCIEMFESGFVDCDGAVDEVDCFSSGNCSDSRFECRFHGEDTCKEKYQCDGYFQRTSTTPSTKLRQPVQTAHCMA